jgi:hypothetical protein
MADPANDNTFSSMPAKRCWCCRRELVAVPDEPEAIAGELTICIECAALNVFADDLTLRAPTEAECRAANEDIVISAEWNAIRRTRRMIEGRLKC